MRKYTEGEVIKVLRERLNPPRPTTQGMVAAKLGMSVQYLNQVVSGARPLGENLAGALGFKRVPVSYIRSIK